MNAMRFMHCHITSMISKLDIMLLDQNVIFFMFISITWTLIRNINVLEVYEYICIKIHNKICTVGIVCIHYM